MLCKTLNSSSKRLSRAVLCCAVLQVTEIAEVAASLSDLGENVTDEEVMEDLDTTITESLKLLDSSDDATARNLLENDRFIAATGRRAIAMTKTRTVSCFLRQTSLTFSHFFSFLVYLGGFCSRHDIEEVAFSLPGPLLRLYSSGDLRLFQVCVRIA